MLKLVSMKLKLEPNLIATKYSKKKIWSCMIGQEKMITITQCLLAPHLKLKFSAQVPIDAVNSKGFLKVKMPHLLVSLLRWGKSFGLSDKKKALFINSHNLFSQESHFVLSSFCYCLGKGSSLSSLLLFISPN